ncbi:LOW QUALITY PROTEIN: hypothetical protein V1477_004804 [Vespula maculifrons]|uniref:Uncharacterized protein n=1 Tax=Vespula maculifrons TaxID=7453 RepID=A0ABD2CNR7_VESMC
MECWFHTTTKISKKNNVFINFELRERCYKKRYIDSIVLRKVSLWLYLKTTTMGLSLPVATIRPFHIIKAEDTIMPKLTLIWIRAKILPLLFDVETTGTASQSVRPTSLWSSGAFWLFVNLIDSGRKYAYSQKDKELKHREVQQNSSPSTPVHFQKVIITMEIYFSIELNSNKTRCIKHSSGVHYLLTVCKRSSSSQPPPSSSSPSSSPSPYHRSHHHHEYRHLSMVVSRDDATGPYWTHKRREENKEGHLETSSIVRWIRP